MILSAHQPAYLPWLGQIHKIALADQFCFFDNVQFQPKSFDSRNRIKLPSGPNWLTVPVKKSGFLDKSFLEIEIQPNNPWAKKHWKSISLSYQKAPYFKKYAEDLEAIYHQEWTHLTELNYALLLKLLELLGVDTPVVRMSDYDFKGAKSALVLDMCAFLGADIYIFGSQGKDYADVDGFMQAGVVPYFQLYAHPTYSQLHGEFEPYMSVIDLLFNCGPASLEIIMSGNIDRAGLKEWATSQREAYAHQ